MLCVQTHASIAHLMVITVSVICECVPFCMGTSFARMVGLSDGMFRNAMCSDDGHGSIRVMSCNAIHDHLSKKSKMCMHTTNAAPTQRAQAHVVIATTACSHKLILIYDGLLHAINRV